MRKRRVSLSYQDGIVVGNLEDKENLKNPISRLLVKRFDKTLFKFFRIAKPRSVHEVGCGEGRLTRVIATCYDIPIRGSDFSTELIQGLQAKTLLNNIEFSQKSIYDMDAEEDHADFIVCCEVLEHLERPKEALGILKGLNSNHYIFSVPREPIWRILNVFRGKYLSHFGNTPGHLNHWSKRGFLHLLSNTGFHLISIECPLPWLMVLGKFKT